jgi:hypothetical protein
MRALLAPSFNYREPGGTEEEAEASGPGHYRYPIAATGGLLQ